MYISPYTIETRHFCAPKLSSSSSQSKPFIPNLKPVIRLGHRSCLKAHLQSLRIPIIHAELFDLWITNMRFLATAACASAIIILALNECLANVPACDKKQAACSTVCPREVAFHCDSSSYSCSCGEVRSMPSVLSSCPRSSSGLRGR